MNLQPDHFVHGQIGDVVQVLVDKVGLPGGPARHHGQVVSRPWVVEVRRREFEGPSSPDRWTPALELLEGHVHTRLAQLA